MSDTSNGNGNKALTPRDQKFGTLKDMLNRAGPSLRMALPRHMTPDRMIRIALSACSRQPLLMECTPQSIALSLIIAAETGLEPNGYEAHLIPYKNNKNGGKYEAQFQPDYKGLVQLAYRSGLVKSFDARVVYEKDDFEFKLGTDPRIDHRPYEGDGDPGALKYAYAIAALKDGGVKFVVLTKRDVERRKKSSRAANNGPWVTHPEAMWAKSAAKELCKWIPRSPELQRSIELDDQADTGGRQYTAIDGVDKVLNLPGPGEDDGDDTETASDALAKRMKGTPPVNEDAEPADDEVETVAVGSK